MAVPKKNRDHDDSQLGDYGGSNKIVQEFSNYEDMIDAYFDQLDKEIHNIQKVMVDYGIAKNKDFMTPPYDSESDSESGSESDSE